jgi:opacity protein-like surface antigen
MDRAGKVAACATVLLVASLAASSNAAAADRGFYFGAFGGQAKYDFERISPLTVGNIFLPVGVYPDPVVSFRPPPGVVYNPTNPTCTYLCSAFVVGGTGFVRSTATIYPATYWAPEDDDESTAWGIVAGYRIMRYAAVELNYQNLGKLEESATIPTLVQTTPTFVYVPIDYQRKLETAGPSVSALGILPILDNWSVYARAGVFFADMKFTSSVGNSGDHSITFGSESFLWGAGTQFDIGKHWSVRAEFQRFDSVGEQRGAGRADIDLLSLGVIFRL